MNENVIYKKESYVKTIQDDVEEIIKILTSIVKTSQERLNNVK